MNVNILEITLIGIGLAMDASAVSATNGMCYKPKKLQVIIMAAAFGVFQAIMPLIGYYAGSLFSKQVENVDHWIALILLGFIGGKMIFDGFKRDEKCPVAPFSLKLLMLQAVATSIDALAIGVSFAAMKVNIYISILIIAIVTFILCIFFAWLGKKIGDRLNSKAEIFGGAILVFIGAKIFIEHMFFA